MQMRQARVRQSAGLRVTFAVPRLMSRFTSSQSYRIELGMAVCCDFVLCACKTKFRVPDEHWQCTRATQSGPSAVYRPLSMCTPGFVQCTICNPLPLARLSVGTLRDIQDSTAHPITAQTCWRLPLLAGQMPLQAVPWGHLSRSCCVHSCSSAYCSAAFQVVNPIADNT